MIKSYFKSKDKEFTLIENDTFDILPKFEFKFDMIFADPPYFLSNDGYTFKNGQISSVNKANWDKSFGLDEINNFNRKWLSLIKNKMKDNATIWITGTFHNIFSIGQILSELDFKILNIITWGKTNPPPNFSHKCFTHSSELIIWAKKKNNSLHFFNYELMRKMNNQKQMKDVWQISAVQKWEKTCGNHPTQKPLALLNRIILASTKKNSWILDPFTGSSTTGIVANLLDRNFLGIDREKKYLEISKKRKIEIENISIADSYRNKISEFSSRENLNSFLVNESSLEYNVKSIEDIIY